METQQPRMSPPMPPPYGRGFQQGGGQNKGCLAAMGCLLGLSILFNLILVVAVGSVSQSRPGRQLMHEIPVSGRGKSKIAVIRMNGVIMGGRSRNGIVGAATFIKQLERARRDKRVKGILLMANSPGGSVTASDKIHNAMLRLKKSKKPVVVMMGTVCASGCVYATAAATKIYGQPTGISGSIGVIMSSLNFSKLMENYGVKSVVIASKKNKALLSPYLPVQEEHKTILKAIVDDMYKRFTGILVKWRKIPEKKIATFADGRVFGAIDAKKYGVIDEIGYNRDAKKAILKLTGLKTAQFVRYKRQIGLAELLSGYAKLPAKLEQAAKKPSFQDLLGQSSPKAYYLWAPAAKP